MAMVDVTAVEELGDLAFFDLFFRILKFFTAFRLLDVAFTANASVSSFTFKKKATECEWLSHHEGSGIQSAVFVWGKS